METAGDILERLSVPRKQSGPAPLGQLPLQKFVRNLKPITPAQEKLLNAGLEITQAPNAVELAFLAVQLVHCTLPHRDPGDVEQWARRNGDLTLGITPGRDFEKNCSIGYPYGSIPRLLLFWLTTEAVRTKKRRLVLGSSLDEFIRAVGLNPNTGGGKRSDVKRLHNQMDRLFAARISFQQTIERHGKRWLDMQIAPEGELWWNPKRPEQTALWESWIEIGERFFQAITTAPVPVDTRALRALKQSPLALDLYVWAAHKAYSAAVKNKSQFVPWIALQRQFGADYKRTRAFTEKAIAALRKIQTVYPGLKLEDASGGIVVLVPSRLAVPLKS
jgi:hypothetical protein